MMRRAALPVAILLALAGCRDVTAPGAPAPAAVPGVPLQAQVVQNAPVAAPVHVLDQSPTAPALRTYQVSFWARHDRASSVLVNYRRAAGQTTGQRFLLFTIPRFGLLTRPDGSPFHGSDSIRITLTIDRDRFVVDFQPSGLQFSSVFTPTLTIWYANANADFNGDGSVDAIDGHLASRLAVWGRSGPMHAWARLGSKNDPIQQFVASHIYHFSEYAVSW